MSSRKPEHCSNAENIIDSARVRFKQLFRLDFFQSGKALFQTHKKGTELILQSTRTEREICKRSKHSIEEDDSFSH